MDSDHPAEVPSRTPGRVQIVPRVVGPLRRSAPVQVRDVAFLRAQTERPIRITIPGPFTMTQQLFDEHYHDEPALAMDCAVALNAEIKDLFAAGADVVQIDEPWMQSSPDKARAYGVAALNRALEGVKGTTVVHICFGYAALVAGRPEGYSFLPELEQTPVQQVSIETAQSKLDCSVLRQLPSKTVLLGVLDLSTHDIETPQMVADRIRRALPFISPDRLIIAPDCGLKYLPRAVAFGKMKAMADGAKIVRAELQ
jgi:5-methyltetrahydropteroyltriglutamate--homocysteine methyltransferase